MKIVLSAVLFLCISTNVLANNLGVIGPLYPIQEVDLLKLIRVRLLAMQQQGLIKARNAELKQRTVSYIKTPPPVAGITHAKVSRAWHYDPTYVVPRNLYTPSGTLVAKKGTRINPLTRVPFSKPFVFIDGTDIAEVHWAINKLKAAHGALKIVLVRGPLVALTNQYHIRFYFDQYGRLTHKLNIKAVPAEVTQAGLFLNVREVAL